MTDYSEIDQSGRDFMMALDEQLRQGAAQVSMYTIGEALGLAKEDAGRMAENLIGYGLIEIRTLAGEIGITAEGEAQVANWKMGQSGGAGDAVPLGTDPVLNAAQRQMIDQIVAQVKAHAAQWHLDFDHLTELMADVKTMDAQLASPRPKSAIMCACLAALAETLKDAPADPQVVSHIQSLLGTP